MLSFRIEHDEIKVYCDKKGMELLIGHLEKLKIHRNHIHLLSPSCGGTELDDMTPRGEPAEGMVTITWFED